MRSRPLHLAAAVLLVAAPETVRAQAAGPATVDLVVAATTDVHGRLRGWDYEADVVDPRRGLARAATIVDSVRRAHPGRVVLLDAGDLLQGNPMTFVAASLPAERPHPVVAAMNAMAYDAAAIGNHEFNYGLGVLARAVRQAHFPFLSANSYQVGGARAFPAFRLVERAGVRVGIVGATTPGVMVWDRDNVRGRLVVRDLVPEVRHAVDEARAAGADIVLVTVHSGLDGPASYDSVTTRLPSENVAARLAREVPGVDLVLFGHSHGEVADTTINGVLLMQPKNWATSVAIAHLALARQGTAWRVTDRRASVVQAAGHDEHPAVVAATQRAHDATRAFTGTPLGRTTVAWRGDSARVVDTPLLDFLLEVMRRRSGAQLAASAAFSLDAGFAAGDITVRDLSRLYPYENTLRAVRVTGAQVRAFLEHSARYYGSAGGAGRVVDPSIPGYNFDVVAGADYVLDLSRPVGDRVTRLEYRGRPIAPADTFTLAVNNYRQTGGGGYAMLGGAPVTYDGGATGIRQLLIDEVRRAGTLRPADYHTANWRLVPADAAARAYAEMQPRTAGSAAGGTRPPAPAPTVAPPSGATRRTPTVAARQLRIVSINDFHGAMEARADARGVRLGGAGALAAAVSRAVTECRPACEAIVLDGGDEFQGTPASNLAFGRPVVELFHAMDVAGGALGNHEFDWGVDTLRARMRQARYRIMGANVRDTAGRDIPWIQDDTIVRRGGIAVGIVGISSILTPSTTMATHVAGLRFLDPVEVVNRHARSLRARGADVVVVVAHEGGFCNTPATGSTDTAAPACTGHIFEFAGRVTERVDAWVTGHTHSAVATLVRGVPVMQARSSGRSIAIVDLVVGDSGSVPAGPPALRDVGADTLVAPAAVDAIVRRATAAVAARVNQPVGRIGADMRRTGSQYALGNLIADAQRAAGKADVAVMNNGGIRADLRAGDATYGTLFEVQPFANVLSRATVRGSALRTYLERLLRRPALNAHLSGVSITYDPQRPEGARIVEVLVGGRPLRDEATYTMVLTDFLLTGGDGLGLQRDALEVVALHIVDLDALVSYIRARGTVQPPDALRIVPVARP